VTDLRDFIAARLDEDEAAARVATEGPWSFVGYDDSGWAVVANDEHEIVSRSGSDDATHTALHDPARVLREVAAKRAILEYHATTLHEATPLRRQSMSDEQFARVLDAERTLGWLAAVYSDHPDYNPEWGPA